MSKNLAAARGLKQSQRYQRIVLFNFDKHVTNEADVQLVALLNLTNKYYY